MTSDEYIFRDTADDAELLRLRLIESVFDEKTQRTLLATGPLTGLRCLEVGAGAGSIATWLGSQVGPTGQVVALDTNARFLRQLGAEVQVIEGALGTAHVPEQAFDLVHARYVLIHNFDSELLLDAMLRALKPGGVLVLEEPDFSAAAAIVAPERLQKAFERVKAATESTFAGRNLQYAFGRSLPGAVAERVPRLDSVEYDCPVACGGSALAEMMRLSTMALSTTYIQTGLASAEDIAGYAEFATNPECWGLYYATVRVLARKAFG